MGILHRYLGTAIAVIFASIALWGLVSWIRNRHPGPWFWRFLGAGQAALVVQAVFGVVLLVTRGGQHWLHYAYGAFPLLVLLVAHRNSKRVEGLEWAAFAIAGFFIFGLQLRGLMTGN